MGNGLLNSQTRQNEILLLLRSLDFLLPILQIFLSLPNAFKNQKIMSNTCTLKFLVVGDSGVGKTGLLLRYCEDTFQHDYLSTIGVDFKIKRIQMGGISVTLNIWDTAGQERFRNITKSFYKGAQGIILVYSINDPDSFEHIEKWIDQIKESGNGNPQMILVGAKSDLRDERKVSFQAGQELAQKYGLKLVQTSAKENVNVQEVFKSLADKVLEDKGEPVPDRQNNVPLSESSKSNKTECCK